MSEQTSTTEGLGAKLQAKFDNNPASDQSLGQKRVRASFNPSEKTIVADLKNLSARMINTLETLRNSGRLLPDQERNEFNRIIYLAQTEAENAAMWAVKAATTQGLDL